MSIIEVLENKIYSGESINLEEALKLYEIEDGQGLFEAANRLRKKYCGNTVDLCSIMNAKSGKCSENCKYCAQSGHYNTGVEEYDLVNKDEALAMGRENAKLGVDRFSLVTSGRDIRGKDFEAVLDIYEYIDKDAEADIELCASHGILDYDQMIKLKSVGVKRYHHNIETSKRLYSSICTTHTYEDRIDTIKNAQKAGIDVCSGGIIGMGETREDRVNMAIELRALGINSIPVNILNPIPGTPFENVEHLSEDEINRTIAVFRFILPKADIRFAGGRIKLVDKGRRALMGGANAMLVGNLLTTVGNGVIKDKQMLTELGYDL